MPKVRKTVPPAPRRAAAPLPRPQAPAGRAAARPPAGALSRPPGPAPARASQLEAARLIVDPYADRGWGFRVFIVGASGAGKTFFEKRLLAYALARKAARFAFVYDFKDPSPSFPGLVRTSVADLEARPPLPGEARQIVFHDGDHDGDPDAVAGKAMAVGDVVVAIDELYPDAVVDSGRGWKAGETSHLPTVLRRGRSRKVSIVFGTQQPQNCPSTLSLCESTVIFRCKDLALAYLAAGRIPREAEPVVRGLQRGEFILLGEQGWDGRVYGPA